MSGNDKRAREWDEARYSAFIEGITGSKPTAGGLGFFLALLDSVESEGRKRGLVQAEAIARDRGDKLAAWMVTLPMHSEERKDKSFRAGECFSVADEIAALASKEETNE